MDLKYVNEASTIEFAEYAVAKKIYDKTAFSWWVYYVFKKLDRIIDNAKTEYWSTTHNCGEWLPKTTSEALELDG